MEDKYIIVEADYGKQSVFVDATYIELTEPEIDLLSAAIWVFHYEASGVKLERPTRKLVWEFSVICSDLLDLTAKKLVKMVKELFPDKGLEFSEENKYED